MISGKHLIAGDWVEGETTFSSSPAHGHTHAFAVGTPITSTPRARQPKMHSGAMGMLATLCLHNPVAIKTSVYRTLPHGSHPARLSMP